MSGGNHPDNTPKLANPVVQERFLDALRSGCSIRGCCRAAGISDGTYYRYMEVGEREQDNPDSPFAAFYSAVRTAEAEVEQNATMNWQAAMALDWKAAMEFLARRFPEDWSPTQALALGKRSNDGRFESDGTVLGKLLPELTPADPTGPVIPPNQE